MPTCKKHNKEKTEIWDEAQRRGGKLTRIGCVDCKVESERRQQQIEQEKRTKKLAATGRRFFN